MYSNRKMILLSSSTVYGSDFLEYVVTELDQFFKKYKVQKVLFIPYAQKDYDGYTSKVRSAFRKFNLNYQVIGIHEKTDPILALNDVDCIFIGGGNTFLLLKTLCDFKLVNAIRNKVLQDGIIYLGSSAGTNVATPSINTTNDMPIIYPPTFDALNLISFNINPHYLDPDPNSTHKGETRIERIQQFHEIPGSRPVVGLREGSYLIIEGNSIVLKGKKAVLFMQNQKPKELEIGIDFSKIDPVLSNN
ncbi:alpha-aspartyl dipeptidase, putative [Pediculus humanus corporis]|uniref:dipeptidase E n=1 Tax=Pediculus humanus subsp. corporis TaxID=121224 RepID=E0VDV5_PEDHC|nr:alpha-aspartyl dipeptidase, putative [Pediculus humanus corporis]EEB11561.1 alpha-aspartyl dipeptidase, putative [Pediculus humanus corporis]